MKVLVYLFDHVPSDSFVHQQLGISSLFQLFLNKSFYFQDPKKDLPGAHADWTFHVVHQPLNTKSTSFLKKDSAYDTLILWPLNQYPQDRNRADRIIAQILETGSRKVAVGSDYAYVLKMAEAWPEDLSQLSLVQERILSSNLTARPDGISSLKLASPNRSFNKLEEESSAILTKVCRDFQKGEAEAQFYKFVPSDLQEFYPPLISSKSREDGFSYQIPRYEMLDLSRFLIHASLRPSDWQKVFQRLNTYLAACPRKKVGRKAVQASLRSLFIDKLQQRVSLYQSLSNAKSIAALVEKLVSCLEESIENCTSEELAFSHGDLCFSNILFNRNTSEMKFVDPRGALTAEDCFLPLHYDFSKISQCVLGQYDWIIAQNISRPEIYEQHEILRGEFVRLMERHQMDPNLVRLGEASLFLSMLPLHMDQPHLHASMIRSAEAALQARSELAHAG